jgi:hypothetical protein
MPKKVSTIKIKSRKLKEPEPVTDEETIQFDSEDDHSQDESEASDATPEPVAKKSTRAKAKPAAKKPADSSSVASSRVSKASASTSSTANAKKPTRAGRGSPEDAIRQIEQQEQRKLTKAQRLAAETAYAQAISDHAAAIKAKTEALNADYKLKQMSLADTRAERQRLMSRLVL